MHTTEFSLLLHVSIFVLLKYKIKNFDIWSVVFNFFPPKIIITSCKKANVIIELFYLFSFFRFIKIIFANEFHEINFLISKNWNCHKNPKYQKSEQFLSKFLLFCKARKWSQILCDICDITYCVFSI